MDPHSYNIPREILSVAHTLTQVGFEAYFVGGCVRDLLIGRDPLDWDITTNATPDEISPLFEETFYENEFGTVGVVTQSEDPRQKVVEITTFRTETAYSDKRRPDRVEFSSSLEEDLKRRDFTINAIALSATENPKESDFFDPFEGMADITSRTIRAVGKPAARFDEDALRMLRAVRLAAVLNFSIETETSEAVMRATPNIQFIATERIRDEFSKIIGSDHPATGLFLMERLGLLREILPEFERGVDMEQNQAHAYSVWEHTLRTVQHAADKDMPFHVKLAAFFHDIGKPFAREWSKKKQDWAFHGHDVVGARVTREILTRLSYPKDTVARVTKLVRWHMFFSDTELVTLTAVRRMVRNVGKENIWDLMELRKADRIGTGRPKESPYRLRKYRAMIEEALRDPLSVNMLAIDGARIMELTNTEPGPHIGSILHILLDEVMDDPTRNTAEYLEKRTKELFELPSDELSERGRKAKKNLATAEEQEVQKIRKKHWVR